MNRRRSSLAASPLLIGAITTLIVVVAVFLSYNANNGLPFVPTYNIKVELPEASGLQPSNQVRIAGTRVGIVSSLSRPPEPAHRTRHGDREPQARKESRTAAGRHEGDRAVGLDDRPEVPRTGKGQLARATLKAGQTIPIAQTREPVDIDELFNMFNKPTRTAIKINTNNFGDGLAGRGLGLNNTIHELRPLVTNAIPVLHNLAAPATGLHELFIALDRVGLAVGAGRADERRTTSASSTPSSRPGRASRRRSKRRTGAGRRRWNRRSTRSRTRRPSTKTRPSSCTCCAPARARCVPSRRSSGTPSRVGAVNLRRRHRAEHAPGRILAGARGIRAQPGRLAGARRLHADARNRQPAARRDRARAGQLQLLDAGVPQPREPGVGERRRGDARARGHACSSPTGVNNEGYPASAPANGPSIEKRPRAAR